jgi:transposase
MPYTDYTTEILGLEDVIIIEAKQSLQRLDIFIMKPRRKHKCPVCGQETDKVHDYRWQPVKDSEHTEAHVVAYSKEKIRMEHCGKRFMKTSNFYAISPGDKSLVAM